MPRKWLLGFVSENMRKDDTHTGYYRNVNSHSRSPELFLGRDKFHEKNRTGNEFGQLLP